MHRADPDAPAGRYFAGLMSGTSVDGVDAVVADFAEARPRVLAMHHVPFPPDLRRTLLALASSGDGEIDRAGEAALALANLYARASLAAIAEAGLEARAISAIGCHGQTIRHRPQRGYTVQIGDPAALAERAGIPVVADFRSADLAAGGQGAPLAPGFHAAFLADPAIDRVVLNLGGIANLTRLSPGKPVIGFDCGPANILLDAWVEQHQGVPYDRDGTWAESGQPIAALLARMLADPFFLLPPPKSTGRELFNLNWLAQHLRGDEPAVDVQASLLALTVESVSVAIESVCNGCREVIVCGGGARNRALLAGLSRRCAPRQVATSDALGIAPEAIEPLAFAWLARERLAGRPGNLPQVTGARGPRVLGAIYPAPRAA